MNTYAIMGASGNIGKILAQELLKKGHQVRAIVRDKNKAKDLQTGGAKIFSANYENSKDLAPIFEGASAIFSFIPPGWEQNDLGIYQDRVGKAICEAIKMASIKNVLNLSSIGAELKEGTGPISGLYRQEQRLNSIKSLNVLHLRPHYFMENLFAAFPSIAAKERISSSIRGNLGIPMIETDDIGRKAADFLDRLDFHGTSIFEYVGPREVTLIEVTHTLGKAIGHPGLKFHQATEEEEKQNMLSSGINPKTAELIIEMGRAFNDRLVSPVQKMNAEHHAPTTIERFAEKFAQAFAKQFASKH